MNIFNHPKVSIGMPVYNGESFIREALDSLINQTFVDFELVISDNASTDGTEAFCLEYAEKDQRIRYVRQTENIGSLYNFKFVLDEAVGEYFMWAAHDDWRSVDFLDINVLALDSKPQFVASTSPCCYIGDEFNSSKHVLFELDGSKGKRYLNFLQNAWNSNSIFYSLIRRNVIKEFDLSSHNHAAMDWIFDLKLLSKGKIYQTNYGLLALGRCGYSNSGNPWRRSRVCFIETIIPLYYFSCFSIVLSRDLTMIERIPFFLVLFKLNFEAFKSNLSLELKMFRVRIQSYFQLYKTSL